jgi:hypothetical protein
MHGLRDVSIFCCSGRAPLLQSNLAQKTDSHKDNSKNAVLLPVQSLCITQAENVKLDNIGSLRSVKHKIMLIVPPANLVCS